MKIVTVHTGFGSMVEGMQPQVAFDCDTEKEAKDLAERIEDILDTYPDYLRGEMLVLVTPVSAVPSTTTVLTKIITDAIPR